MKQSRTFKSDSGGPRIDKGASVDMADLGASGLDRSAGEAEQGMGLYGIREWVRQQLSNKSNDIALGYFIDTLSMIVISEALKMTNGNRSQAAKLLNISRPTFHAKVEKYGIKLKTEISDSIQKGPSVTGR